jgi:hypothetical protein
MEIPRPKFEFEILDIDLEFTEIYLQPIGVNIVEMFIHPIRPNNILVIELQGEYLEQAKNWQKGDRIRSALNWGPPLFTFSNPILIFDGEVAMVKKKEPETTPAEIQTEEKKKKRVKKKPGKSSKRQTQSKRKTKAKTQDNPSLIVIKKLPI